MGSELNGLGDKRIEPAPAPSQNSRKEQGIPLFSGFKGLKCIGLRG